MNTPRSKKSLLRDQNGQAVILVAVAFAFLAIMVGLAVDAGRMYVGKGRLDTIADAAAIAGAKALVASDGDAAIATETACNLARVNGIAGVANEDGEAEDGSCPAGVVAVVEEITKPDGSVADGVVVTARRTVNTTFMRFGMFFGCGDACKRVNLSSRQSAAVAYVKPTCIYALDEQVDHALRLNGTGDLISPNCGVYVRSASAEAIRVNGTTYIDVGGPVDVVGGVDATSNSSINPTPTTGAPWQPDPLGNLPTPAPDGSCQSQPGGNDKHFTPGHYCEIDLKGNSSATFEPGAYYIDNGFTAKGNSAATGDGVTFYIASGSVQITGNSEVHLTAPTDGLYEGITFFQARENTQDAVITGSHELRAGGLYFAGAALEYRGGSCQPNDGMLIVANTILISGSTCISMPDAVPAEMPLTASLVQ